MKPSDFIERIAPGAVNARERTGILAGILIAQAALESGWGNHAPGNNLFGIKAGKSYDGPKLTLKTTEIDKDGKPYIVNSDFRSYLTWGDSIEDYAKLISSTNRYRPAMALRIDPQQYIDMLQACGYSTNPEYGKTVMLIYNSHNLGKYDAAGT